eukprot:scaffold17565_cov41-Tisochrysis_lutea.AAC.1
MVVGYLVKQFGCSEPCLCTLDIEDQCHCTFFHKRNLVCLKSSINWRADGVCPTSHQWSNSGLKADQTAARMQGSVKVIPHLFWSYCYMRIILSYEAKRKKKEGSKEGSWLLTHTHQ